MDLYWQKIEEALADAADIPESEYKSGLARFCAGDEKLKAEIESLLSFQSEAEDFLEKSVGVYAAKILTERETDFSGKHFGHYKIVREIGRGGMGTVFLAERADGEFQQKVALKIVRQTFVDKDLERHFKKERQILANLNHPNVAKLLDGGVSERGEPFLVMEFIDGETLLEFAEKKKLDVHSRLNLFLKICQAIAFAHRNLIVHRDIKPSNILVTGDGEPKLLDFGLAKALDDVLADESQTQTAFRALTPAYASPEQLCGETVTTASDIYSLGKVLDELLIGKRLTEKINSKDEQNKFGKSSAEFKTNQSLNSELRTIVAMAMRKEPERRYQLVENFAEDIENFLNKKPIKARPSTFRYRAAKFIKRHAVGVAATCVILLVLIGGIIATIRQSRIAQREKTKAEIVNAFLQNMLNYSDNSLNLSRPKGQDMTVKDVLNAASKRLETEDLSTQPEVKAELQRIIGASYLSQEQYDLAEKNLISALEVKKQIYGEDNVETLQIMVELAGIYLSKSDYSSAEKIYQERLSILRREQQKGAINPTYLLSALNDFAVLRRAQGNSREAETILREGLALKPEIPEENKMTVGIAEAVFALVLSDEGNFDEAEKIVRQRIAEIRQQEDSENLELAANLTGLGTFLMEKGKLEESLKNLTEAEAIYRKLTNPLAQPLGDNLRSQAQVLYRLGNYAEAEEKINKTLEIYRQNSRPQFINYPTALTLQGLIFNKTNRAVEAEKVLREAVKLRSELLPKGHFLSALSIGALGEYFATQKRYEEAEPLLLESYESLKNSQGADSPRTLLAHNRLTKLYEDRNKSEQTDSHKLIVGK